MGPHAHKLGLKGNGHKNLIQCKCDKEVIEKISVLEQSGWKAAADFLNTLPVNKKHGVVNLESITPNYKIHKYE